MIIIKFFNYSTDQTTTKEVNARRPTKKFCQRLEGIEDTFINSLEEFEDYGMVYKYNSKVFYELHMLIDYLENIFN